MPRLLSPIILGQRESLRQLVAADPASLATLGIPVRANQGILRFGTFMTIDGDRALTAGQAAGVLAFSVDSDLWEDGEVATIYTNGRFVFKAILDANPGVTFDPLTVSGLAARQIRLEAMADGSPRGWISLP